jgi:acylphosphatase
MPIGDGIRRNVAHISQAERDRLRNAILTLNTTKFYPDGVSYWDKQDQIHEATHVHGGPAFLPWHRELCNRFEALLREVDPQLSLHYWDWTTDPRNSPNGSGGTTNLFTTGANGFMGSASGLAGPPLTGFNVTRAVQPGAPGLASDSTIVNTGNAAPNQNQYQQMRAALEGAHNTSHGYIGGTIGNGHTAFEDPFVFLLHSNVDRLFAMWQLQPGKTWRLDPNQIYGVEGTSTGGTGIMTSMEPWAGGSGLRPWAPPDNQQVVKNSKHPSVVAPPAYDTNPQPAQVWSSMGGVIFDPVTTNNQDGRLEVFAKGSDGALWHIWQTAPSNGWSGWASLGGGMGSPVGLARNLDGRIEIVVRGTDGALWHKWQTAPNSGWSAWASLGGVIVGTPAIGRNADGRLEIFARGTDGALWHIWQTAPNSGWSGWASLGGVINNPVVVNNADGRLEVFVRGSDNAVWHIWQTAPSNGWSGWGPLGGVIIGGPVTGRNQDGRLEIFVKGTDSALWHKWQSAPSNGWA